nr:uncharacterized protein LOC114270324 isoform X1 [Ipomoea batatas]
MLTKNSSTSVVALFLRFTMNRSLIYWIQIKETYRYEKM